MTTHDRDKVIAAAKESGGLFHGHFIKYLSINEEDYVTKLAPALIELGRQAEREDCAKVCEKIRVIVEGNHPWTALHVQDQCIKAIRARGDTK